MSGIFPDEGVSFSCPVDQTGRETKQAKVPPFCLKHDKAMVPVVPFPRIEDMHSKRS